MCKDKLLLYIHRYVTYKKDEQKIIDNTDWIYASINRCLPFLKYKNYL